MNTPALLDEPFHANIALHPVAEIAAGRDIPHLILLSGVHAVQRVAVSGNRRTIKGPDLAQLRSFPAVGAIAANYCLRLLVRKIPFEVALLGIEPHTSKDHYPKSGIAKILTTDATIASQIGLLLRPFQA